MRPLLLAMPGNQALTQRLASLAGIDMTVCDFRRFPDGESYVRLDVKGALVRGRSVAIVCTLDHPDDKLLALIFMAENLRELGARRVGLVSPYLPYMRQDKRFKPGEALTSESFARLISSRFDWLVTVDPHLHRHKALSEIYDIPTEVVPAAPLISAWIREHVRRPIVIGPDEESEQWVASVAKAAGAPHLVLRKTRTGDRRVRVKLPSLADLKGLTPVIVDDIVSTARTMIETVVGLKRLGARAPQCVGVHGIFADTAYMDLKKAGASAIVTCNTVVHRSNRIDIAGALAPVVQRISSKKTDTSGVSQRQARPRRSP
ncbi:MAG: ribose-phosphate pyrophosphokinase [Rhodospirillaceae bacterium]